MLRICKTLLVLASVAALFVVSLVAAHRRIGGTSPPSPVLGSGRGIDHVGVFVRDLEDAERVYRDVLGFRVPPGGSFPGGVRNSSVQFETNYLELITVDPSKVVGQKDAADLANFLQKREGAGFVGLHVSSAQQTADFLHARGFDVAGPEGSSYTPEGSKEVQTALWQTVSFKRPVVPADAIFFIQYAPRPADAPKRNSPDNPNTALGIHAVWMAVHNLEAAVKAYESVGLRAGRKLKVPTLGAKGREVQAGRGMILLLQASDSGGVVASYLAEASEGIMGVSIQVRDLETARAFLETNTKQQLAIYKGPYGKSISVSPKLTHGVQIELFHE